MHARNAPKPPPLSLPIFHFEQDNNQNGFYYYDDPGRIIALLQPAALMRPPPLLLKSPTFRRPSFSGKSLDSIEEERADYHVNLGAESPRSIMNDDLMPDSPMSKAGIAANTQVPPRTRLWRSLSFINKTPTGQRTSKEWIDRDCGICFEMAIVPCRTLCCGKLFCLEHLADWLHGSSSDGRCPSCESLCILERDTLSLASPQLTPHQHIHPTTPFHRSSASVDSQISTSSSESESNSSSDGESDEDTAVQSCLEDPRHLSEDAMSRIMGKVLNIVALMVFFYALLSK